MTNKDDLENISDFLTHGILLYVSMIIGLVGTIRMSKYSTRTISENGIVCRARAQITMRLVSAFSDRQ